MRYAQRMLLFDICPILIADFQPDSSLVLYGLDYSQALLRSDA